MYVKQEYINAVLNAIDFISCNVDGADDGRREQETLETLGELFHKMKASKHRRLVNYYVRKKKV